jgi:hypothetical protein
MTQKFNKSTVMSTSINICLTPPTPHEYGKERTYDLRLLYAYVCMYVPIYRYRNVHRYVRPFKNLCLLITYIPTYVRCLLTNVVHTHSWSYICNVYWVYKYIGTANIHTYPHTYTESIYFILCTFCHAFPNPLPYDTNTESADSAFYFRYARTPL